MSIEKTGELLPEGVRAQLEAEHGPVVAIGHPDGSCFAFRRTGRAEFDIRRKRVLRGDQEADDKLLQERCVWPTREAWNTYVAQAAFETLAYLRAYKLAHGAADVRRADAEDLPESADGSLIWLTNEAVTFAFRKPGRAEVKMFQAAVLAASPEVNPVEQLLRACAAMLGGFSPWLDANLFGIEAFGDAFVGASGMVEARAAVK